MSESSKQHKSHAPKTLTFGVFICSTSRAQQLASGEKKVSDVGGDKIVELLQKAGQKVVFKKIIPDDETALQDAAMYALGVENLDVAIFSGGTGITPTDITIETVTPFFEKTLPGFGEFFRRISYDKVGSPAVLSRATAGVAKGRAFFCIPGSPDAVQTALETLILPEASHIVKHAREQH
ncbi:MAG: MogA/MoaB family molybdenum cofactor biosynthesis protein [Candidatus Bathyarchaeota archaeon]|nr:MogA/MoaB family molybdenum cofactor biosynthesis protein [Candidatus Bathyarchaeota archaeon]